MSDFSVFLSGKKVDLITLSRELAENSDWHKWFNDDANLDDALHHYYPNSVDDQISFYENSIANNNNKIQLGIVAKSDNKFVGVVSLNDIDYVHRNCSVSGIIGVPEYRNMVIYSEAVLLLMDHAFNQLNLHKIYGGTISEDIMKYLIRVLRMSQEGVRKQHFYKNGEYRDCYLLSILKDEFIEYFGHSSR